MADPGAIASLAGRWKAASAGVADGAQVASLPDSSSAGYTLTNGNAGTRPYLVAASPIGGKPALACWQNGNLSQLGNATPTGDGATQTISVVFRATSFSNNAFLAGSSGNGALSVFVSSAGKVQVVKTGQAVLLTSATTLQLNTNYVVTVSFTANGPISIYINGAKDSASTSTGTATLTAGATGWSLGAGGPYDTNEPFRGFLAEAFRFTSVLATASRATLHTYAQDEYSITVADYSPPAPATPTSLTATPTTGQVALAWTASTSSVSGYRVYRRGALLGTTSSTNFTEAGLPGGVRFDYAVTAVSNGVESDPVTVLAAATPQALKPGAPKVIWGTDMSADIDDLGAVAVLHALADLGEVQILAMTVSTTNGSTPLALNAINAYYGRPDIPIGIRSDTGAGGGYPATIASEFPHPIADLSGFPNATTLLRQQLAAAADGTVTLITVGFLHNLQRLMDSTADAASPQAGPALIAQKVKTWVCMGGQYPGPGYEYNFYAADGAPAATYRVVNDWPTAALYAGFEIGDSITTGGQMTAAAPAGSPIRRGYEQFNGGATATRSWDQVTTYAAIRFAEGLFGAQSIGRNTATSDGHNTWVTSPDPTGPLDQAYLLQRSAAAAQTVLDTLMNAAAAAAAPSAPTPPTNLRGVVMPTSRINLAWTRNSWNETGFIIERLDGSTWTQIGTPAKGATTFTDANPPALDRSYRVKATNTAGTSTAAVLTAATSRRQVNVAGVPKPKRHSINVAGIAKLVV